MDQLHFFYWRNFNLENGEISTQKNHLIQKPQVQVFQFLFLFLVSLN